jgi:hypothetical protein
MNKAPVLIISDDRNDHERFLVAPYNLSTEDYVAISCETLKFTGLSRYSAIAIDSHRLIPSLKKVALGICDNGITESLWSIFSKKSGLPVYIIVDRVSAPTQDMKSLGIEYVLPADLKALTKTFRSFSNTFEKIVPTQGTDNSSLTADEIRELYQQGIRRIPANRPLTMWAKEVAESLGMTQSSNDTFFLYYVKAQTISALKKQQSELFDFGSGLKNLYFVIDTPLIPVFKDLFPSLSRRVISPTISWEKQGAFTGETSLSMLLDQNCAGAMIPPTAPYTDKKNLDKLLEAAKKKSFMLFSTFPLAQSSGYGIISPENKLEHQVIPILETKEFEKGSLPDNSAVIIEKYLLQRMLTKEGNRK